MWPFSRKTQPDQPVVSPAMAALIADRERRQNRSLALTRAASKPADKPAVLFSPPELPPGVVPSDTVPAIASDSAAMTYAYANAAFGKAFQPFPGYQYLAQLMTRAEYRSFASALSTELTREWIEITSTDQEGDNERVQELDEALKKLGIRETFRAAAEHEVAFGRGQLFIDVTGPNAKRDTPLLLTANTIPKGSLKRVVAVEPMWTTPSAYNAIDPAASDFYRPTTWFMLGQEVHASRLMTIITRPLPDMLKPAYNFSGMSLSQLAEPYVENWLRTRQSVSDMLDMYSVTGLGTSMDQVLQGNDDGADVFMRAELFTRTRSNKGLMLYDKEREELMQLNAPLSGLHELQAQSQEHLCSVSRIPAIILTGISPSGLNASSDGEVRMFYDWISAQQEAFWRGPLETIIKIVQLSLWGEIDPDISFVFRPLWQMNPKEEAEIRALDAQTDSAYVDRGILDPTEVRERLAADAESGYLGLDTEPEPELDEADTASYI